MATKITKAQNYTSIREILVDVNRPDLVEFVDHELELIANKAAKRSSTPTKAQKEGAVIKERVYNALVANGSYITIDEIKELDSELAKESTNKIVAQLKKLIDEKVVVRDVIKRKTYYKAV